jgi:hypothetical protein
VKVWAGLCANLSGGQIVSAEFQSVSGIAPRFRGQFIMGG